MTILIAYASKHGSTQEIAERITEIPPGRAFRSVTSFQSNPIGKGFKVYALEPERVLVLGGRKGEAGVFEGFFRLFVNSGTAEQTGDGLLFF